MYRGGDSLSAEKTADLLSKNPEAFGGSAEKRITGAAGIPPLPGEIMNMNLTEARESFEKYFLEFQLSKNRGIISKTAEAIGVYPSNLHAKLKKYRITMDGAAIPGGREER
jgi:two-component system nitrogen regulation response regulator NtrX